MTALAVNTEQSWWEDKQLAALKQMGLEEAPKAELALFLHYCQRTGLDPFARQIYMVGRGNKWTIQSSIDGLRIVAQRSNEYAGQTPVYWCGSDGVWVDVWISETLPVAAKVGVYRKGFSEPLWAIAKFESYAVYYSGKLSNMWAKMPDLMIAKCAEALALRKAFPQDLSGIYTNDEMAQVDSTPAPASKPKAEAKPVVKQEVSAEDYEQAQLLIAGVENITEIEDLRSVYTDYPHLLEIKVNGTTLLDAINAKKKVLNV